MNAKPILSVAYSGADYSGKTTQAKLSVMEAQKYHVANFGSLSPFFDPSIMSLSLRDSFSWWFRDCSMVELVDKLSDAYLKRCRAIQNSEVDIAVFERGVIALTMQVAANFATRNDDRVENYYDAAKDLVSRRIASSNLEPKEIILIADKTWIDSQAKWQGFSRSQEGEGAGYSVFERDFYSLYIQNFQKALSDAGAINNVRNVVVDGPAVDVNNFIRKEVGIFPRDYPPLFAQKPIILGISGLSESGKSTFAEQLRIEYGFHRIKLGYFNELMRDVVAPYARPNDVAMNLVHFVASNRHMRKVSVESVHSQGMGSIMKLLIGDNWQTVFLDVDEAERARRAKGEGTWKDQFEKDSRKKLAGVLEVREMADLVIRGTSSLADSVRVVTSRIRDIMGEE